MYRHLCLPIAATGLNLLLAIFVFGAPSKASASLIPVQHEGFGDSSFACADDGPSEYCLATNAEADAENSPNITVGAPIFPWSDPSLKHMPTTDFMAYVRPDVSTFYKEEPGSRHPSPHTFVGQAGKFINMTPHRLNLYWDAMRGGPGHFSGVVNGFESTGTATFPGHAFFFGKTDNPKDALCRFVVNYGTSVYYCDPYSEDRGEAARGVTTEKRDISELSGRDLLMYNKHRRNLEFAEEYKDFTGIEWLGMYPRDPPRHKIWPAEYFGQEHHIATKETQFVEMPPWDKLHRVSLDDMSKKENSEVALKEYRGENSTMDITLRAVSCAPRIFEIPNFISHVEADHILMLTNKTHSMLRSTTGDSRKPSASDGTRTSLNTWVYREESPIIDSIYKRVADMLQLDEALLRRRRPEEHPELGTKGSIAEPLQMVHYDVGQEYTAHHDFGYNHMSDPYEPSRSINVLLYLNDVEEGGETSFPRWLNAESTGSLDVKPEKGKAVLFYMLLPDGNSDDLTQHAALPVIKGEKWMSNLWIWDPFKM